MRENVINPDNKIIVNNKNNALYSKQPDSEKHSLFDKQNLTDCYANMFSWEINFSSSTISYTELLSGRTGSWSFYEFLGLVEKKDADRIYKFFLANKKNESQSVDIDIKIKQDNKYKWFKIKGFTRKASSDSNLFASGVAYNIENSKADKRRLEYLEKHDYLTGLNNMSTLDAVIQTSLQNGVCPQALVVVNIDNLKEINDTLSYHAGNTLIKNVANVLKECFYDAEVISRVGGGEYCALFLNKNELEIDMKLKEANMMLHKMYLNLIKTQVDFGYAISKRGLNFCSLYRQATQSMQKQKNIKRVLTQESLIDKLNDIISLKTGWGKRAVRIQSLALQIGKELGCREECLSEIKVLGKIADIGLIGLDDSLIKERVNISGQRKMNFLKHVEIGRSIISSIDTIRDMEKAYLDIYKRYDEYKDGLNVASKIIAGSIGFDDIVTSNDTMRFENIKILLLKEKAAKYCPKVIDAIIELMEKNFA